MRNRTGSLVVVGATVVDPATGTSRRLDVAFGNGRTSALAQDLPLEGYERVLEVDEDVLVVPGLIDIHGHFYHHAHPGGVDPDRACLPFGVTAAVDAGSCGWATLDGFRQFVVPAARTKLYALVNLSSIGTLPIAASGVGELKDEGLIQLEETEHCLLANKDRVLGLKIRLAEDCIRDGAAERVLEQALDLAGSVGQVLMVHVSHSPVPVPEILRRLRPGDILTHVYNGTRNNLATLPATAVDDYLAAQERGVLLDVAHAGKHFDRDVARSAIAAGLVPDTISTDMHYPRPGFRAPSLIDVANELIELGLGVDDALAAMTERPGRVLRRLLPDAGTLRPGSPGDAALLRISPGADGAAAIRVLGTVLDGELLTGVLPYAAPHRLPDGAS
ncbi:MAG: hypothetical protein AB7J32_21305 [Pseudonocardia sp.]